MIDECVAGLAAIGALADCAGLLTGYLGKAEIGEAALRALAPLRAANPRRRLVLRSGDRRRRPRPLCRARGRRLLPRPRRSRAPRIVTPNAFELEWLDRRVRSRTLAEARAGDRRAFARARAGGRRRHLARARRHAARMRSTSSPATRPASGCARTPRLPIAVNGAGDLFAALFFHHWLEPRLDRRRRCRRRPRRSFGIVAATLAAGRRELALVDAQEELVRPSQRFPRAAGRNFASDRHLLFSALRRTDVRVCDGSLAAAKGNGHAASCQDVRRRRARGSRSALLSTAEAQTVHRHHVAVRRRRAVRSRSTARESYLTAGTAAPVGAYQRLCARHDLQHRPVHAVHRPHDRRRARPGAPAQQLHRPGLLRALRAGASLAATRREADAHGAPLLYARRLHRRAARGQSARGGARLRGPRRPAHAGDRARIQSVRDRVRRSSRATPSMPRGSGSSRPAANCRSPAIRRSARRA